MERHIFPVTSPTGPGAPTLAIAPIVIVIVAGRAFSVVVTQPSSTVLPIVIMLRDVPRECRRQGLKRVAPRPARPPSPKSERVHAVVCDRCRSSRIGQVAVRRTFLPAAG